MYNYIKNRYYAGKITNVKVWEYADKGFITEEQAFEICGPRPAEA